MQLFLLFCPTGIGVPRMVLVLVSTIDTLLSPKFVIYILLLAESNSSPVGLVPTGISVGKTVLVLVSITDTLLSPVLGVYIRLSTERVSHTK